MPPDTPMSRWTLSWVVGGSFFVVAHVAAALSGGAWWGLHHLRYLDSLTVLATLVASLGVAAAITRGRPRLPAVVGGAAAFPVFWLLRDRSHWLGDGDKTQR